MGEIHPVAEYVGDERRVALQQSIRARRDLFKTQPLLANGGRVMTILDPDAYGWDQVRRDAEQDGFLALTMVDRDATLTRLAEFFGPDLTCPYWEAFTGLPDAVRLACRKIVAEMVPPKGWKLESLTNPDDATIDQSQRLNEATGVAPQPAYYLRGRDLPSLLTCLRDADGLMVACANATMRYHPQSPLAGWMFAGGVSVDPTHRGKRLGTLLNARMLLDSHSALGWCTALEQARASNRASVAMIEHCGLRCQAGRVTFILNLTGEYLTR